MLTDSDRISVLAVTPDLQDHDALDSMLPQPQWRLHKARSLRTALTKLKNGQSFPVVLCERDLAPDSWRQLLDYLMHLDRPPLLIVMSHLADERLWAEALNLGAYDVLAKPFDEHEVVRALRSAWRRWRQDVSRLPQN